MGAFLRLLVTLPLPAWGGGLLFTEPFNPSTEGFEEYCARMHLNRAWSRGAPEHYIGSWDWWLELKAQLDEHNGKKYYAVKAPGGSNGTW